MTTTLTQPQICLGASARSTHRGKSIKNLIRHGHDGNALVRITLRNAGGACAWVVFVWAGVHGIILS